MLRVLLSRVRATLRRSRLDDELDDELREHLAMLQERFVRNGMDPSEAFYAARRQFGGVTQVKEALMERSALPSTRSVFADLRYAFRVMFRTPSLAVAVVSVLARPVLEIRIWRQPGRDLPHGEVHRRSVHHRRRHAGHRLGRVMDRDGERRLDPTRTHRRAARRPWESQLGWRRASEARCRTG